MVRFRNDRLPRDAYTESGRPSFITVRAYRRQRPFTRQEINDAIVGELLAERTRSRCDLYAFCLMPDHLHVLAAPRMDGASVLRFVDRFKGLSTSISWQLGWHGKLWQPRYYDHVLRSDEQLDRVCEYIVANPVRAGLAEDPAGYRWCKLVDLPPE